MASQQTGQQNGPATNASTVEIRPASDMPPEPQNFGESPPFAALVLLFDAMSAERKQDKRKGILERWFQMWRQRVGPNVYPALRLILPKQDKERAIYHSKEANIAKALARAMGIEGTPDATNLLHWKRPQGYEKFTAAGDFPALAYQVVAGRSTQLKGTLRINEVNDLLDDLSRKGSRIEQQTSVWAQIYDKCTPNEIRWIIRIILKDLNAGAKETTVLSIFHPDAMALFNSCSDLKRVAYELWDPHNRIDDSEKNVQIFRMFLPMLSKRPPKLLSEAVKRFRGVTFRVEEKLDGERIQLHKRGNEYFYASRKGKNYTYLYGKNPEEGSLTPFIHRAFHEQVYECILDGEMLVWDPISERYLPFGTLKSHASGNTAKGKYNPRPCFKVFDLLYLNGISLTHQALSYRTRNLENVFATVPGRLEIMQHHEVSTVEQVQDYLNRTIEGRGEGLILKHPNSIYVLNGRLDHWIKIKPEYMDGAGETFDLLVVGGNHGTGHRGGGVSTLICAVREDQRGDDTGEVKWASFARLGTGLSFADFLTIRAKPWIEWGRNGPPFFLTAPRSPEDKGDVYLKPEDSFIVTVKAAAIGGSDQYYIGKTLRFPRIVRIRDDAGLDDVATASDVDRQMMEDKKRKQEDTTEGPNKRRKIGNAKKAVVSKGFQATPADGSEPTSTLFSGKKFVIPPDPTAKSPFTKPELEKLVRANGGGFKAHRGKKLNEDVILIWGSEKQPTDIKMAINHEETIVRPQWITDSVKKGRLLSYRAKYFYNKGAEEGSDTESSGEESDVEMGDTGGPKVKEEPVETPLQSQAASTFEDIPAQLPVEPTQVDLENDPHADWVKVEPQDDIDLGTPALPAEQPDEDTDHEEPGDAGTDLDDWEDVFERNMSLNEREFGEQKEVVMGETDDAMEYDQEKFFKHLVFYLDSPSNARTNGLKVSTSRESQIEKRLAKAAEQIQAYGGRITTDIEEPKLTHVIMDNDDLSRRTTLMKMTEKPKRRRFVLVEWVDDCVAEGTLMDEDNWLP